MLTNRASASVALDPEGAVPPETHSGGGRSSAASNVVAFAGAFGLVLMYALRGGSYDIVAFEEYGLLVWWLLAVGIAVGVLPRVRPARLVLLACGILLAYAAWTALSLTWSQSGELTTEEIARSLDYLGLFLLLSLVLGRGTWRAAAAGLAFGALAVCLIAIVSRLAPAAFPANVVGVTFKTDRLSYPFGYWNAVAAWGAMSATIGLAWSAHVRTRISRAAALAMVPTAVVATYLSYSRAGVVGICLGVIVVLASSRNRLTVVAHAVAAAAGATVAVLAIRGAPQIGHGTGDRGALTVAIVLVCAMVLGASTAWMTQALGIDHSRLPSRAVRSVSVACLVAALALGAIFGPSLVRRGWHSFTQEPAVAQSADPAARLLSLSGTRYAVWKSAIAAFDAHPLDGTGAGTFEFWWNRRSGPDVGFLRDAHNLWLENLAELGLPGLLLIVAVASATIAVATTVRRKARRTGSVGPSTAFLAALVVFLFHASVDWMWESTAVTVLALAGVAVVGARLATRGTKLTWWVRAVLVAMCIGAGVVQLPGLLSTTEIRRSQAAERVRNGNLALALANDAIDAEPWSASAYEQRALVLEAAGRYNEAAAALSRAIANEPTNYVHWLNLARVETERGRINAALIDYSRAHHLRPQSVAFVLAPTSVRLR